MRHDRPIDLTARDRVPVPAGKVTLPAHWHDPALPLATIRRPKIDAAEAARRLEQSRAYRRALMARPFRTEDFPRRSIGLWNAAIGDVLAGHVEVRSTCGCCGHSAIVPGPAMAQRHPVHERLKGIWERFRCSQCAQAGRTSYGHPTLHFLAPKG